MTTLLLKNLVFTILAPGTLGVLVPVLIAGDRPPVTGVLRVIALSVLALGASIYARCVWDFASFGRGTPAPIDPPKRLVVRGLYRYVRNPMHMGILTVILGWAMFFGDRGLVLYAVCVFIAFHAIIRLYEEPHLRRDFGPEYSAYTSEVRRWLPRRPRTPDV